MARRRKPSFEGWQREVNQLILRRHGMSLFELDDDIPRDLLLSSFESGVAPDQFVEVEVSMLFTDEEDYA